MSIGKNKTTEEFREFWSRVESIAETVRNAPEFSREYKKNRIEESMTDEKAAATLRKMLHGQIGICAAIIAHRETKQISATKPCRRLAELRAASDLLERLLREKGL